MKTIEIEENRKLWIDINVIRADLPKLLKLIAVGGLLKRFWYARGNVRVELDQFFDFSFTQDFKYKCQII